MATESQVIRFFNAAGQSLSGRLDQPAQGSPLAYAVFAHCFTCSKDIKSIGWISKALAERGIAVLRFDFTGLGDSEGKFSETTFSSDIRDILSAVEFMRSQFRAPSILMGHSLGGTAVLAAAPQVAESRLVVTIAAPAATQHIRDRLLREHPDIMERGSADVNFGGRTVRIRREFLDDLDTHDVLEETANLNRSLMVFHAAGDEILPLDHGLRIFQAARPPKNFICLEGADHLLLRNEQDALHVADVIAAWARRHLAQEL